MQKIFDLIRKEDVVLWVGSGFSGYAGYPMGKRLTEIIYDSLSNSEKEEISNTLSLPELAEEFVRIKGGSRNALNRILKDNFLKASMSLKWHELISKIPHIKTIITTNYDNCFESVYKDRAVKLINEDDLAYADNKKEIFKVHGDLQNLTSVIITKSDYANYFFNDKQSSVYWSTVIERIASKTVVFVGYNFEDDNVKNIFQKISNALKTNQKERFLIAPGLSKHKEIHLSQLGIQYVDMKGEIFVEKLYKNIHDNIIADFDKGHVKAETLGQIMANNGIQVSIKNINDRYLINSIHIQNGTKGMLSLEFKENENMSKYFSDFVEGKKFGELEINGESLTDFKFIAGDVNLIGKNKNEFILKLGSLPSFEGLVDIEFDGGLNFSDIYYKIYSSKILTQVVAIYKNFQLVIDLDTNSIGPYNLRFNYEQKSNFKSASDGVDVYNFLHELGIEKNFKIYPQNGTGKSFDLSFKAGDVFIEKTASQIHYFELMKKVEVAYKVRFRNITLASDENYEAMTLALKIAENSIGELIECDAEVEFKMTKSPENIKSLSMLASSETPLSISQTISQNFDIHGQTILIKGKRTIDFFDLTLNSISDVIEDNETVLAVSYNAKRKRESYFIN